VKRLSVVIPNYNYERYVGPAIESALAIDWDDVEVVVVDDGSTDGSRAVIERYADRITAVFTENRGQREAVNRGFTLTSGDVVVVLDSDDVLAPELAERLAAVWTPTVSKVQFQARPIDEAGVPIGRPFPVYRPLPSPADIRRWMTRTSAYPTAPGSGNAYARWFLERIFPVGPDVDAASDSACLAAAPFLGDVVTVPEVLVGYRRHGANDSNLLTDVRRFPREVTRARSRWRFAQQTAHPQDDRIDERPLFRSRELLQLRVAALRMVPDQRPLDGDGRWRMLRDTVRSPFQVGPEGVGKRLAIAAWCAAALLAPQRLAHVLVQLRYGRRT
jgi:glycosyltransferase involved in cell wall biosynthesis